MKFLSLCLLLSLSPIASADEIVVIANKANTVALTVEDVRNIFLGKTRSFPNGSPAIPIELKEGKGIRSKFNDKYLLKNDSQLRAYWAQLVFTGKATPPKQVASEEEIRLLVARNPNVIGYITADQADDSVRIIGN